MLQILDRYIIKRYLGTFIVLLILFIPIGIMANLAEKIDNIMAHKDLKFTQVLMYYFNFTIHFANLLFPLLLFISVIWFTSKMANQTEIIAILSSGISFNRFLRPYLIGATIVVVTALGLGMFIVPKASKFYNEFNYQYLKSSRKRNKKARVENLYRKISETEYIYAHTFFAKDRLANTFTLESFEGTELKHKISADKLRYLPKDSIFRLTNYVHRTLTDSLDRVKTKKTHDTVFNFNIDALTPVSYVAETLDYSELQDFIERETLKGSPNLNRYKVVAYKRWSLPVSVYILTIIGVAVSSIKRRGGMGANLAFGLLIAFGFVFFDKVFGTMASQSDFSPVVAVWFPNFIFCILAWYLLKVARR